MMLSSHKSKQNPGTEGSVSQSTQNILTEQERILQAFVSIGRSILHGSVEKIAIRSDVLLELNALVEKADRIGVHGMVYSDIDQNEESTGLTCPFRRKFKR